MSTSVATLPRHSRQQRLSWDRDGAEWPNREFSRFVTSGEMKWHVQTAGAGPAMLLLHGTGASTHSWRDVLPLLAERFTVTAIDLPGHGFTDPPPDGDFSLASMARKVAALVDSLRVKPDYCVGHSAGAVVGVQMALRGLLAPGLLISINGAFFPFPGLAGQIFGPLARLLAGNRLVPALVARFAADPGSVDRVLKGTGSRIDTLGTALYQKLFADRDHVSATLGMMAAWDLHGLQRNLWELETPLVLIVGENDTTVPPRDALRVVKRVAAARVINEPGLGHLAHEEAPERIVTLMVEAIEAHAKENMDA